MKKMVSIMLTLTLLLALSTFSGAAIPAQDDHIVHDTLGICHSTAEPTSVNAEVCTKCGEQAFVFRCNQNCRPTDTGTHTYKLTKTCTITYTTSMTLQVCNKCGNEKNLGWHPMCDEIHSACGLGHYPTCTIFLY